MPSSPQTLTLRLNARQREAVRRLAEKEGVSEEEAVLGAIDRAIEASPSMLDLMGDLVGSVDAPSDLATSKAYLEGYGSKKLGRGASGRKAR
jgi:hypothetical protein